MRKFLFAVILMLAFSGVVVADGSDPMPLCRPTANHQCPQLKVAFDGGPKPVLCPPKQQCPALK